MTRLLALALFALALATSPAAAQTTTPTKRSEIPSDLDGSAAGANVIVHYRTSGSDAVTPDQAAAVVDAVEKAVAKYAELGFPRVIDDGDGKADVYYYGYATANRHGLALSEKGTGDNRRSGFILLNSLWEQPLETVKHEYFHLVQLAIVASYREDWFSEATASWARWQVDDPPAENFMYYEDYPEPLNCQDVDGGVCAGTKDGYTRWPFFALFDASFVHDILDRIAALSADKQPHGFDAMVAELAERGTTLQGALMDLGTRMVQGTLPYAASHALLPVTELALTPPANGSASAPATTAIDHASLRFAAIKPTGPCAAVPLALTVQGPADVAGVSFVQRGGDATPLALGETTVAWKACADNPADVVIANGTAGADAQSFSVTGRVVTPTLSALNVPAKVTRRANKPFKFPVKLTSSAAGSLRVALQGAPIVSVGLKKGANAFKVKGVRSLKVKKAKLVLTPYTAGYAGAKQTRSVRLKTEP